MENIEKELELRRVFLKEFNIPFNIVEDPFFDYYINYYEEDFGSLTKWNRLKAELSNYDSIEDYFNEYYSIRDKAILFLKDNKRIAVFDEVFNVKKFFDYSSINLYNQENVGRYFIQIDLKKANFQAIKFIDKYLDKCLKPDLDVQLRSLKTMRDKAGKPNLFGKLFNKADNIEEKIETIEKTLRDIGDDPILGDFLTYQDFIKSFETRPNFLAEEGKHNRQVIFGKVNPKTQQKVETHLCGEIITHLKNNGYEFHIMNTYINTDEIIISIDDINNFDIFRFEEVLMNTPYSISWSIFNLKKITLYSGQKSITGFVKLLGDNKKILKGVPINVYPQFYKRLQHEEPDYFYDSSFIAEGALARYQKLLTTEPS